MPTISSPTVKRRRLAAELRTMRDRAGLTIDEVAGHLEWSPAKISRIENARVRVLPRDVKFLLRAYGADEGGEDWDYLLTLARESQEKSWWSAYGDAIPEGFRTYVGLEAEAETLRTYEPEVVPGLLQTEDYARAIMQAGISASSDHETEKYVAVRMARQARLLSADPPELWAVVGEAAIRCPVGGVKVMKEQLERLIGAGWQPNLTIQVLPFSVGAHVAMGGAFMIVGFPDPMDSDVIYMDNSAGSLFLEKPGEQQRYTLIFNHLRAAALSVAKSRELIARIGDELASASQ